MASAATGSQPVDKGTRRQRFWAPEVVQTSAMDCGPAALKCLLEGFGVPVSYGRLREACQTSVDGTSIDTLEDVARLLGLDAEQIMLPVEHVTAPEADVLPAIAVVQQPSGMTHFVVLWRRVGRYVQVMDPARGRRWVRVSALSRDLYLHTQTVDAGAVQDFVADDGFTRVLRGRLRRIVRTARAGARLPGPRDTDGAGPAVDVQGALPLWQRIARVEGATRAVESLIEAGTLRAGAAADHLLGTLIEGAPAIADSHACARAVEDGDAGPAVAFRGAVLIRIGGLTRVDAAPAGGERGGLPPELAAALDEAPASLTRTLLSLWSTRARRLAVVLAAAAMIAAVGTVAEAVLARPLLQPPPGDGAPPGATAGVLTALLALGGVVAGLLVVELALAFGTHGLGRRLDLGLRRAFLHKLPRLGDRYFGSRPVSDMAERAHLLHRVRGFPVLAAQLGRVVLELGLMAAAIAWLHPPGAPVAAALFAVVCAVPLLGVRALAERDLRWRAHSGSLMRFYLDALLGLSAVRTHGAEQAVAREHGDRLREWRRAGGDVVRTALVVEGVVVALAAAGAAVLVADSLDAAAPLGTSLLVLFLSLGLPVQAARLIALGRQLPDQRTVALRLIEPLGAPEEVGPPLGVSSGATVDARPGAGGRSRADARAVAIALEKVRVEAGGHVVLDDVSLEIAAGTHVAVVGPSGAGKSTLAGLLLGFHAPASGLVRVDGAPWSRPGGGSEAAGLAGGTVWVEPAVQLWNRSLAANVAYGAAAPPSPEDLGRALNEAELSDLVARLPAGVETALGEGGALLSGGEGQRVRFARELVRVTHPRLVVLDEPFRGLDRGARQRLLARARARWAGTTLLAISHDIEHTADFPRVLVVEGGRVVEDGEPRALAANPQSRYRALLDAEATVRAERWASDRWRRWLVAGGEVVEPGRRAGAP